MLKEQFQRYLKIEKQYSPLTESAYLTDLEQFSDWLTRELRQELFEADAAAQITHKNIRAWMAYLIGQGHSTRTVGRKISSLKTFFDFLQKSGIVETNPAARVKTPGFEKKLPSFLKKSEAENLFDQVEFADDFEGIRDRTMLELFYGCGLRRAELMSLRAGDINEYDRSIRVTGKGNKERIIPFGKHVETALNHYLKAVEEAGFSAEEHLFMRKTGENLYPKLIHRIVNKYLSQITSLARKSPHILRHTFATHLLDNGADLNAIKELLGHSSLASTQVYTHNSISKLKAVHTQAHPRAINHKSDSL
ncbi:MAG: tyrosine-type recombinase/integrase [Bacteroidia bacterium]|nr:tyrosine-type recombinase/integrase [Bacteroidia bacterium]